MKGMSLGHAYRICLAHGYEAISINPRAVWVRGYGEPWSVVGFIRLAEALEKPKYVY